MKFLLEFVACGGSCSSGNRRTAAETRMLVVQEEPIGRKQGKGRGEWRPSLSSISEDSLTAEKISNVERTAAARPEALKRKVSSASQRDRTRSLHRGDGRRAPVPPFMPAFSPTPYMF